MNDIFFQQFYSYFVYIFVGFLIAKLGIINHNNQSFLSDYILKISFPLLLITTIPDLPFQKNIAHNVGVAFGISYFALLLLGLNAWLLPKFFSLSDEEKKIFRLHGLFGNIVFIGFPFINSLFPSGEGLLYAAVFQIASDSILWTWGISYIQSQNRYVWIQFVKKLFNINTFAFFTALILWFLQYSIPTFIEKPFEAIGRTTLPLALIYVGYVLSTVKINETLKKGYIYYLAITKLLLVPIMLMVIVKLILPDISTVLITAIVLQSGMPAMATIAILAKQYLSDDLLASENILITTIFSTFSLPLLWFFVQKIF